MIGNACPPGFKQGPNGERDCVDIDECTDKQYDCQEPVETCVNSVGGYYCEPVSESITTKPKVNPSDCAKGFRFSKLTYQCEDIDECRIGQHSCNLATHDCINTDGSFTCAPIVRSGILIDSCRSGFRRNRWSNECEDVNECETQDRPCRRGQTCQNTIGSYACYCQVFSQLSYN
jgi:hypothetical protein